MIAMAVSAATTRRAALLALGVVPHSRTYRQLREACERYGLQLPGQIKDDQAQVKTCKGCCQALPIEAFAIRRRSTGLRQSRCRACRSNQRQDHYHRNRNRLITEVAARKREMKLRNMIQIVEHFTEHPCVDCGERDSLVLQFDHIRGMKAANVSTMIHLADWSRIAAEIAKCVVRCANCHHRKTATSLWWVRAVVAQQVGHLPSKQA